MPKKSRVKMRENKEQRIREERLNQKNEFGMTDLTPWEAVERIRKTKRA